MVWIRDLDGQLLNSNTIVSFGFGGKYLSKKVYATTVHNDNFVIAVRSSNDAAKKFLKELGPKLNMVEV